MQCCKLGFVSLLLFISFSMKAQSAIDSVDLLTYQLFMNNKPKEMMVIARKSIKEDIDFHYLRLRMGIVYFNKGNYRRAVHHFRKANKFYADNELNTEYLYYSMLWGGRDNDAYRLAYTFNDNLKTKVKFKKRYVDYLSTEFNYSSINTKAAADRLNELKLIPTGYQTLSNTFSSFSIGANHRLGSSTNFTWSYYRLSKNDYLYENKAGTYTFYDNYAIHQEQMYGSINQTIADGLSLTAAFNYIRSSILGVPFQSYGRGSRQSQSSTPDTIMNFYSTSIAISKEISQFSFGYSYNQSNFSSAIQHAHTASVSYYPLGSMNLYLTYSNTLIFDQSDDVSSSIIYSGMIGYKIFKYLWNENYLAFGNMRNYSNLNSYYIYNDLNTVKYLVSSNFIIPINKIKIYFRYAYMGHESVFQPYLLENIVDYNKIKYSTNNFTGGILWFF